MRTQARILVACLLIVLMPAVCWAQHDEPAQPAHGVTAAGTESHASGAGAHGEGDHEKPALMQFDPGAAIWSIIIFGVLLIVLRATAWKPILRVLNEREEFIQKTIDDAKHEREEAEKLLTEYKAQIEKARQEATAIVEEGRRDAEVVHRRLQDEARQEAEQVLERARREIKLATDSAVKGLYDHTAELAVKVAAGIIRKEISPEAHKQLVAESVEAMKASGPSSMN